jgi:hypothetical protein
MSQQNLNLLKSRCPLSTRDQGIKKVGMLDLASSGLTRLDKNIPKVSHF